MAMMEGRWKLVFTGSTQTLMLLNAIDSLPLVDIGGVYQTIDAQSMTAVNKVGAGEGEQRRPHGMHGMAWHGMACWRFQGG